jgi:methylated-DNA-protein-cysteine methyltransferase-like protein
VDEALVERVLSAVELIPAGQVVSYGDLGGLVGCGPRQVGSIMARFGGGVPWWRVVSSSGDVPAHLRAKARPHWAAEGIVWKPNGLGCRIASYRTDLVALARECDALWESGTDS